MVFPRKVKNIHSTKVELRPAFNLESSFKVGQLINISRLPIRKLTPKRSSMKAESYDHALGDDRFIFCLILRFTLFHIHIISFYNGFYISSIALQLHQVLKKQ